MEVLTPDGNAQALFTYILPDVPTIGSVSPDSGSDLGGTIVHITGTGFLGATDVEFDGTSAAAFTVYSDTLIQATTPAGAAGTWVMEVITPNGDAQALFTYVAAAPLAPPTIGSVSPDSGSDLGGTIVHITGTGFLGATDVEFDGTSAAAFTVYSDTLIQATTPAGTAGTWVMEVITPNGDAQALFTYVAAAPLAPPTIGSVSPESGSDAGGTVVTIVGTGFTGASAVDFGALGAGSYTVLSDTLLQATSPAQAAGTVILAITAPGGTAQALFTYIAAAPLAPPTIGSVSPDSGSDAGGTVVTIVGTGFTGASAVDFGALGAGSYTVLSDTLLQATSPAQAAGTVILAITAPGGTANALFTYVAPPVPPAPTISSVRPRFWPYSRRQRS